MRTNPTAPMSVRFDDAAVADDPTPGAPSVLVVGGDTAAHRGVMPLLAGFAGRIAQVATAAEAIDLADGGDYGSIVVDLGSDPEGYEAVCELRLAGVEQAILFISARGRDTTFAAARALGATDVMARPVCVAQLERRIGGLAEPSRHTRPRLHLVVGAA